MDKYDILEAMSGIRDKYIEEAAVFPEQALQEREKAVITDITTAAAGHADGQIADGRKSHGDSKVLNRRRRIYRMQRWAATVAALLCVSILIPNLIPGAASIFRDIPVLGPYFRAVSFRTYDHADNTSNNPAETSGMVTMASEDVEVEAEAEEESGDEIMLDEAGEDFAAVPDKNGTETGGVFAAEADPEITEKAAYDAEEDEEEEEKDISAEEAMTDAGITGQVRDLAAEKARIFESLLREETGYQSLRFTYEVTTDTEEWFSLKTTAFTPASEGFEQVTHFNIRRKTTEFVTLETLFGDDISYIKPLSEEVIRQMREQMTADPDVAFWLDSEEGPDYDFQEISPYQDFYFNTEGELVLCFNEGEAAPMYMGAVEFVIPRDVTQSLLTF